ncbi:MAG: tyrosine-type recombinase/integrase [Candidatus Dormibacteria bacterium]
MTARRRGQGEGWIGRRNVKRKDGRVDVRWEGRLNTGTDSKGRHYRSVYGATQQEVIDKLKLEAGRLSKGLPAGDRRVTVATYLKSWLETVEPRLRPSTMTRYRQIVQGQLIPHLGRAKLTELTPANVGTMLARLQTSGLSPRTAGHCRAVLRAALADAERNGEVSRNVAKLSDAPRVPRTDPKVLTPVEARTVLEAMADPALRRLATVALNSGLRQGELLGLRWRDVDFESGELHIGQALQRVQNRPQLVEVKSSSSRRTVPLTEDGLAALREEQQAQRLAQLGAGSRWRPAIADLVFTTDLGKPRHGSSVTHAFEDALSRADLPKLRWHHLRHAYAGLVLASGVDLATVSHLLGHSSVALTASTYAGVGPSLRQDAAKRLGSLLRAPALQSGL